MASETFCLVGNHVPGWSCCNSVPAAAPPVAQPNYRTIITAHQQQGRKSLITFSCNRYTVREIDKSFFFVLSCNLHFCKFSLVSLFGCCLSETVSELADSSIDSLRAKPDTACFYVTETERKRERFTVIWSSIESFSIGFFAVGVQLRRQRFLFSPKTTDRIQLISSLSLRQLVLIGHYIHPPTHVCKERSCTDVETLY